MIIKIHIFSIIYYWHWFVYSLQGSVKINNDLKIIINKNTFKCFDCYKKNFFLSIR